MVVWQNIIKKPGYSRIPADQLKNPYSKIFPFQYQINKNSRCIQYIKKPATDHQKPQQAHPRQKGEAELNLKQMFVS